jgi:paraquat-inducible protein B
MDQKEDNAAPSDRIPDPKVRRKPRLSVFWIVPLLTVVVAGWLAYQTISERGPLITISLGTSDGLEAGKTKIKYRGVDVGEVEKIKIGEGLSTVALEVRMSKEATPHLTEGTRFWVVRPEIGVGGVSGLSTLISGDYIAMKLGEGKPTRHFDALADAPIDTTDAKGLRFVLQADELGSVNVGTALYYNGVAVGQVEQVKIDGDSGVLIHVIIKTPHEGLVRDNSRFWNVSGVKINFNDILNASVKVSSIRSLIAGGIAFANPEPPGPEAKPGKQFELLSDRPTGLGSRKHASVLPVVLTAADSSGLDVGKPVTYRGLKVGEVTAVQLTDTGVEIHAAIREKHAHLVRVDSVFWNAGGIDLSLSGLLSGTGPTPSLKNILRGGVSFANPSKTGNQAKAGAAFELLKRRPAVLDPRQALNVTLVAETLAGIKSGDGITYRGLTVGRVEEVRLSKSGDAVEISTTVEADHAGLVRTNTVFWNASGLSFKAGDFLDASLKIDSLASLVAGGITFATPDAPGSPAISGATFELQREQQGSLKKANASDDTLEIVLEASVLGSVKTDDPVLYREFQVGRVRDIHLSNDADQVRIIVGIKQRYAPLIKSNTVFWNASGLHASFGLFSGAQIDVESMSALLRGGIALATPKDGGRVVKARTVFHLHDRPKDEWKAWAPHIRLPKTVAKKAAPERKPSELVKSTAPDKTKPDAAAGSVPQDPIPTTVTLLDYGDSVRPSALVSSLEKLGFVDVAKIEKSGAIFHLEATWQGKPWTLVVDARDGQITAKPR